MLHKLNRKQLLLGEHSYLDATDECYFVDAYECANNNGIKPLILALKKGHEEAVVAAARQVTPLLPSQWLLSYTFVPMPSSSGTANGLTAMVKRLPAEDIRNLILQKCVTPPSHSGWRLTPLQRLELLAINEEATDPKPNAVAIVDDVLATGSHFRAAKIIVCRRWTGIRVIGLFLARANLTRLI